MTVPEPAVSAAGLIRDRGRFVLGLQCTQAFCSFPYF